MDGKSFRKGVVPAFMFAVFALLFSPLTDAKAQTTAVSDIFVVSDVPVDETAQNASDARAAALVNGQVEAARRLFMRLTREAYHAQLSQVDADALSFLVDSLQIDNERTSNVRYLADLTVRFKPETVRDYLRNAAIPFAEVRSRPVLIVPVLLAGGGYVLWEEPNPWRAAWQNRPVETGLLPVVAPIGDLTDFTMLTADQAMDADAGALGAMADRYGAGSSVVALASITGTADTPTQVDVTAARVGRLDEQPVVFTLTPLPEEMPDDFLKRAADTVVAALEDGWKELNAVRFGESNRIHAAVPVRDLAHWIEVRRRLGSIPAVSHVRLLALTPDSAEIELDFFGEIAQLERALDRFDFVIEDTGLPTDTRNPALPSAVLSPAVPAYIIRLPGA